MYHLIRLHSLMLDRPSTVVTTTMLVRRRRDTIIVISGISSNESVFSYTHPVLAVGLGRFLFLSTHRVWLLIALLH